MKKYLVLMFAFVAFFTACAPEEVSIDVYHHLAGERRNTLARHLQEFLDNNSHVKVNFLHKSWDEMETMMRRSEREAGVDFGGVYLIAHDRIGQLAENRYIQDIDEYMRGRENALLDNALEAVRYQDRYYGFPVASECVALYYNKNLVEAPPETLDAWAAMKSRFYNPSEGRYLLVMPLSIPYYVLPWVLAQGGEIFDEEGRPSVDSPDNVAAFAAVQSLLFDRLGVLPSENQTDAFIQGKIPFMIQGPWGIDVLEGAEFGFGVGMIPEVNSFVGVQSFVLSSRLTDSQKKAAIRMFASLEESGFSREFSLLTKSSSPLAADSDDEAIQRDPIVSGFAHQAAAGIPMNNTPNMALIWEVFSGENLQRIFNGRVDVADFLAELQREITAAQD